MVRGSAYYGQGTGSIVLDDVNCNGNEATLLQCPRGQPILSHDCGHGEDVGVLCSGKHVIQLYYSVNQYCTIILKQD